METSLRTLCLLFHELPQSEWAYRIHDSEGNMITKPQDRLWAILPGSKLLVNQTACVEEI